MADMTDEDILTADGFDDALIGYTDSWSGNERPLRAVYDRQKCIDILFAEMDCGMEECEEYFDFNVAGGYAGPNTPVFVEMFK